MQKSDKPRTVLAWIRANYDKGLGWLYSNMSQCAIDLDGVNINPESYSREIRSIRREMEKVPEPGNAQDFTGLNDFVDARQIPLAAYEIASVETGSWANQANPNGRFTVKYKPKKIVVDSKTLALEFSKDIQAYTQEFQKRLSAVKYKPHKEAYMYEIALFDLHAGMRAWAEETGHSDYNMEVFVQVLLSSIDRALQAVAHVSLDKIVLALNGDIFNADNEHGTTSHGTWQSQDGRESYIYSTTWKAISDVILFCRNFAPVEVVINSGNHDFSTAGHLGETLKAMYWNDSCVTVDSRKTYYKYIAYGSSLLGLTHGDGTKANNVLGFMAQDVPILWGASKFREVHMGHLHTALVREFPGGVVRYLRALSPPSDWIARNFRPVPALESVLWSKNDGVVSTYNINTF